MTDYRTSLKTKLDKLEKERKRILTAIAVLDEIDSEFPRSSPSSNGTSQLAARPGTIPYAILSYLESSAQMMSVPEIYDQLALERTVSRPVLYAALHRLRQGSKIYKSGSLWGLVGRDYTNDPDSADHEQSGIVLTQPIEH